MIYKLFCEFINTVNLLTANLYKFYITGQKTDQKKR